MFAAVSLQHPLLAKHLMPRLLPKERIYFVRFILAEEEESMNLEARVNKWITNALPLGASISQAFYVVTDNNTD